MKKCTKCESLKECSEFHKHCGRKDGLADICKTCKSNYVKSPEVRAAALLRQRERYKNPEVREKNRAKSAEFRSTKNGKLYILKDYLKRNYGIGISQYNEMFQSQNGCCAICHRHETEFTKRLHVDHDHESGKVRELLCHFCNTALGGFNENIDRLNSAVKYLIKHSSIKINETSLEE